MRSLWIKQFDTCIVTFRFALGKTATSIVSIALRMFFLASSKVCGFDSLTLPFTHPQRKKKKSRFGKSRERGSHKTLQAVRSSVKTSWTRTTESRDVWHVAPSCCKSSPSHVECACSLPNTKRNKIVSLFCRANLPVLSGTLCVICICILIYIVYTQVIIL